MATPSRTTRWSNLARRTNQSLIVAFVDVDHLKEINDSRGHAAGDRILIEVASALRANLRAYDLVIRYGGDEFVVTISGLTVADAAKRFAAVSTALGEAPERGSVSIGLAELQPEDLPEELVARADAALYQERDRARGQPAIAITTGSA
jgi:diguanylate cyclase (GGDEF)-like protein